MTGDRPDFIQLMRELCTFPTGVVADANDGLFACLRQELPFEIQRFRSNEEHNGWVVPKNWRVQQALLWHNGDVVFDGMSHTLAVARYSRSFVGDIDREALENHLVTNPDLPDAYMFHCMWQYRPWSADWALSIPHRIYRTLGPGQYRVELKTVYEPGEMLIGVYDHHGQSDRTIVFNTNTCHPHQANDGFAAVAVLVRLFQWLLDRKTNYSYRLVLAPEHLGSVFYLRDLPQSALDKIVSGVFMEMPGTGGMLRATSTFLGGQVIDRAFANVLRHHSRAHFLAPWRRGAGNDETVWEAPGYEIPFVELTRSEDPDHPYREYHSSLDCPDLMDDEQMFEVYRVLKEVIGVIESNAVMHRRFRGLIALSNPKYDLYLERFDPTVPKQLAGDADAWGRLLDSLFRYFDGRMTILDIAEKHGLPFERLRDYLRRFHDKGLVAMEFAPITRVTSPARAQADAYGISSGSPEA